MLPRSQYYAVTLIVHEGAQNGRMLPLNSEDIHLLNGASSGDKRRVQCCYAPHDCRAANGLREAEFSLWPPLEKGIHEFKWKPAGTQSDCTLFNKNDPFRVVSRWLSTIFPRYASRFWTAFGWDGGIR